MKTLCFLLTALTLAGTTAAQDALHDSAHIQLYFVAGFNEMFARDPGQIFDVRFPYTTTASPGTQAFKGALQGTYHPLVPLVDCVLFDFMYLRHGVTAGLGVNRLLNDDFSAYIKIGYDYTIPFHGLSVKPGIDLVYFAGRAERMGAIDNVNQTVTVMGLRSKDTYTATVSDDGNQQTFATDHLDVDYIRSSFDVGPRVTLSTRPLGRRVILSLQGGWMLPLIQGSRLTFRQESAGAKDPYNSLGSVPYAANGSVGGAYVGLTAGILMAKLRS